ncbi:hypothetical protein AUEXF2481DRAFT_8881 [Aureobasidium subglaciale EXF-2481]|uniref:AA1-like domain-containing protein n=1 Tax=Aureobasidium subglaciale (strain EXF-2481) TaxID=1043005 RepID=A0A074Y569_AURSE|nr:uncharacterized protein AUEXF2481DRAFT_8881 [Aureobasidium subglaciale EXF-2481]KEQ91084.1 hypothetical protein AUEXF2481DRAFT_8881 [Aureobasidium subglaciale EXF-2481]
MHACSLFLAATFALVTTITALPHRKRLAENEPWHLTNLAVFTSSNGLRNGSISFNLVDNNVGLQVNTFCFRSVASSVEDGGSFYPCGNKDFNFRWDGTTLRLQRRYIDSNVGPCPLYCTVTAYGNGTPKLFVDYVGEDGNGARQDALDIFITEMVA